MAEIKWIKITTNMFDDEKIRLIECLPEADAIFVIWIKLLTLAGKINDNGNIYLSESMPYTDEMLSVVFNKSLNIVRLALFTLEKYEMIEIKDAVISIINWDKHQNVDAMQKIREDTKKRVAKCRESKKLNAPNDCNATVTLRNAIEEEEEEEKKKNKRSDKPQKSKYGDLQNVKLTDKEVDKLNLDYGEIKTLKAIQFLSSYKKEKTYKTADDNLTIRRWVIDAVNEKEKKKGSGKKANPFDELLREELENEQNGNNSTDENNKRFLPTLL